jgi:nitrogen fixation protein FixH
MIPTAQEPVSATARAPARRSWDGMVALIVGIFALVVGVNGAMLWFTLSHPPQLVSASYYEDARSFSREMAAGRASAATGWQVQPAQEAAVEPGRVVVAVADARGRPVTGLVGHLHAYRPSDEALDQDLPLTERPGAPGRYEARFSKPRPGRWELIVTLAKGDARLLQSVAWVSP